MKEPPTTMANPWLPSWLGHAWAGVFAVILCVHLWHTAALAGPHRLWHGAHVLMALGMVVMFAPTGQLLVRGGTGAVVFGGAAAVSVGVFVGTGVAGAGIGRLWLVSALGLAAMAYMFAVVPARQAWLTIPLVAWFVLEALGWASGRLGAVLAGGGLGGPRLVPAPALVGAGTATASTGPAPGARLDPQPAAGGSRESRHRSAHRWVRVTLAVMAVGMAYMLLAMQFGMPAAVPAHHMPGM